MWIELAIAVSGALAASPTVSNPIRFAPGLTFPTTSTSAVAAAWNGTAFQLAYDGTNGVTLNRLTAAPALLDSTGVIVSGASTTYAPLLACNGADCLLVDGAVAGFGVSQSAVIDGPLTLVDLTFYGSLAVSWDGAHYMMLWLDEMERVRAGRFDPTGAPLDGLGGLAVATISSFGSIAGVSCTANQCLAVWESDASTGGTNILAARIATSGSVLDGTPLPIATTGDDEMSPSVASDGTQYLVSWMDAVTDGGFPKVRTRRVTSDGGLLDGSGVVLGEGSSSLPDEGPCTGFDGQQFWIAWVADDAQLVAVRDSSAGAVLDAVPRALATLAGGGGTGAKPRCVSSPGAVMVTFVSTGSAPGVPSGVVLSADAGVSAPAPLAVAAANQTHPSLSGFDGGFELVWTEQAVSQSTVVGVAFGATGLSAEVQVVPSTIANTAVVSCDGPACLAAWLEASGSTTNDTVVAGFLPAGAPPVVSTSVVVSAPGTGLIPTEVVAVHNDATWEVAFDTVTDVMLGNLLTPNGQLSGSLTVLYDASSNFANIESFGGLGVTRGDGQVWLSVAVDTDTTNNAVIDAWAFDNLAAPVGAAVGIGPVDGPASLDFGSGGLLTASFETVGGVMGEYVTLFSDAGTPAGQWPVDVGSYVALAFDGQQHLAAGAAFLPDAGVYAVNGQLLLASGQPSGAPFEIYRGAPSLVDDTVIAAMASGAFAVAWTELDLTLGVNARRVGVALVSMSGLPNGSGCISALDCASFTCIAGVCSAAPDAGTEPSDAGVVLSDGGGGLGDAGLRLPDGGSVQSAPQQLGVGCESGPAGPLVALGLLAGFAVRRRRALSKRSTASGASPVPQPHP
jgi:MYXO-CTERM domain-containing protein